MNNPRTSNRRMSTLPIRNLQPTSLRALLAGVCALAPALVLGGLRDGPEQYGIGDGGAASAIQITGKVHGGQQPVVGSTIQLYTVGTGGLDVGRDADADFRGDDGGGRKLYADGAVQLLDCAGDAGLHHGYGGQSGSGHE